MTYSSEVLADAPLAYYRLGEASGTTMADASGNARDGTYAGSPGLDAAGLLAGDTNTCVHFSGSSSGKVPYGAWMDTSTLTLEAWANLDSTAGIKMLIERDPETGSGRVWQLRVNGTKLQLILNATTTITGTITLAAGVTYHLVATIGGGKATLYVNGALDTSAAFSSALNASTQPIWIGLSSYASYYPANARLDESAIYGTALSAARIQAHYAAGTSAPPPPTNYLSGAWGLVS